MGFTQRELTNFAFKIVIPGMILLSGFTWLEHWHIWYMLMITIYYLYSIGFLILSVSEYYDYNNLIGCVLYFGI